MHSKPRLALAILTSPTAAFEEILSRGMLGTGLTLVVLTGLVAIVTEVANAQVAGSIHYFAIGKENPLCWLGLCMLYALILQGLLQWTGARADYVSILIVLGWSHVLLLLLGFVKVGMSVLAAGGATGGYGAQLLNTLAIALPVWYVAVVALGIQSLCKVPVARAALTYIVVAVAVAIALGWTYSGSRMVPFEDASFGLKQTAAAVIGVDQTPWIVASALGLVVGIIRVGQHYDWRKGTSAKWVVIAGLAGASAISVYVMQVQRFDYYGRLKAVKRAYNTGRFGDAAERLKPFLKLTGENEGLMLDIADYYYIGRQPDRAVHYYKQFISRVERELGRAGDNAVARATTMIGASYAYKRDFPRAIAKFKNAAKLWPKFRDPWVRLAVVYNQMGDYDAAVKAANYALRKLDSKAPVASVALAQAYVNKGNLKQAGIAIGQVREENDDLAAKIGKNASDYKNAIDKLSTQDLSYPLEKEPAPPEKKSESKPRKRERKPTSRP